MFSSSDFNLWLISYIKAFQVCWFLHFGIYLFLNNWFRAFRKVGSCMNCKRSLIYIIFFKGDTALQIATEIKPTVSDKKSVKTILSQLLPNTSNNTAVPV